MGEIEADKQVVLAYHAALQGCAPEVTAKATAPFLAEDLHWRGMHPFDEIRGAEAVADRFWMPLKRALTGLQRRQDVFFGGRNTIDGFTSQWVVSMGHLLGLFDGEWLGIRPTGRIVMLRYGEFHRLEGGRIVETAQFFDIPHLMMQAGQNPFPPQTGAHLVQPGPMTQDGVLLSPQPEAEGVETLDLIERMIGDLGTWNLGLPIEEELARTWHDDMLWWGPAGIGATYTIERYAKQHAGPFRAAFSERAKTQHLARLAEGHYGGFFGWPNFTARHDGGFMGMGASPGRGEFRVIDIYRRDGDKLAENWIFIDMLHFWKSLGVDILARMETIR